MKHLLATTALVLVMGTSAFADNHMKPLSAYDMEQTGDIYASELIGMRVYATENDEFDSWNADTRVNEGAETEWDDIGEINDVILGRDGQVKAVILGIGGFIGLGERDVAVTMDDIKMVQEQDDEDDFFIVVKTNKAMLEQAEPYERSATMEAKDDMADTKMEMDDEGRAMLRRPAPIEREGYREAKLEELTAEDLTGARVYGTNDEDIGEVDELILDDSGQITKAVLDIGGFLGLGEHEVAVTMKELRIVREDDGDDVRVYIDATKEELEAQPEYNDS